MAGRNSTPIQSYLQLAEDKNLIYSGVIAPNTIRDKVEWRCMICNRLLVKSYHQIKYGANPCRCRSKLNRKMNDYNSLATNLGIRWIEKKLPVNIHTPTRWENKEKQTFIATYHQLGYNKIPNRLKAYIE